ncbi:MAG TPA: DedA family protein [Candidatus Paceibacterota bacterium]|nr:DedA family protein [Candidatus Paceibacterota bacterium]
MPLTAPFVQTLLTYRYWIAYPLAIVEGPVVMMVAGFLVRLNFFDFWPIYLTMIAGDLTGDVIWYFVGRHGGRPLIEKYGHWINISSQNVERAEEFFKEHQTKILFISKLTTGFGFAIATLIAAGAAKVSFKKYITINFFGEFIWAGFLFALGYFFGNLYFVVDKSLRWGFVIGLIITLVLIVWGFGKAMRKRFGEMPPKF